MSHYIAAAYDPKSGRIRPAMHLDDYFGRHQYGVRFDSDGPVYPVAETYIPTDREFVAAEDGEQD